MRVADHGVVEHESWIDPVAASVLYPDELAWEPEPAWEAGKVYQENDLVRNRGKLWRAQLDTPTGEPGHPTQSAPVIGWEDVTGTDLDKSLPVELALAQATWLLDTLTSGRLHGVECWVEDYAVHSCEIKLRRGPLLGVRMVKVIRDCGRSVNEIDFTDYCIVNQSTISVCCGGCGFSQSSCGCGQTTIRVHYTIGANTPPGTPALVAWLAAEHIKATRGQKCALPERVSNVSRQGVSWTILDPQDFLDKGRTGISRIDQWLEASHRQTGRATMIDPIRSDRVFGYRENCGPRGEFGDQNPWDKDTVGGKKLDPFSTAFRVNS